MAKPTKGHVHYINRHISLNIGPGCSKLTMLLINISLKFQMLISEICQHFFVEKI